MKCCPRASHVVGGHVSRDVQDVSFSIYHGHGVLEDEGGILPFFPREIEPLNLCHVNDGTANIAVLWVCLCDGKPSGRLVPQRNLATFVCMGNLGLAGSGSMGTSLDIHTRGFRHDDVDGPDGPEVLTVRVAGEEDGDLALVQAASVMIGMIANDHTGET